VAKGSGREARDVAELIQRFSFMQNMMGSIGQQAGMLSKIPGMKQMAQANQLRNAVKTGGLEGNPMMANLAEQLLEAAVAEGGLPPGMSGLPGMGGFPGMGGMPGMVGMPGSMPGLPPGYTMPGMGRNQNPRKKVDKDKKKKERKQQKKSRQKSRK
jgi:signal recognition particle subunit SRP54